VMTIVSCFSGMAEYKGLNQASCPREDDDLAEQRDAASLYAALLRSE